MTSTTGDRIHTSGDHIESLPDDIPDYHTAALPDVKYTSQSSVKDEFTSGAGSTGFYHDMRESVASSVGGDITGGWVQSNASLTQGPPVAPTPRSDAQSKTVRPLESSLPSRPRTALRFIVRPYDSQTFKGFEVEGGGNVPNKTASRPATGTKQRGVGVGAVAPGKKRGIASKSEMALTKGAVETKAEGKYPPRHHHHSLHHLPLSPTPTLPSRFHCRTHPAPYPHPIALPPLRTRTGLLGISNRNTPHSAYEDRLRAWGLTRAGCSSDERVLCVPGENGDSRHQLNGNEVATPLNPQVLSAHIPSTSPAPSSQTYIWPTSLAALLHLLPPERKNIPAFLSLPSPKASDNKTFTRHGSNTAYTQDTRVGIQPSSGNFYASEPERLDRTPFWKVEKGKREHEGRKGGVRSVPGRRSEEEGAGLCLMGVAA